MPDTNEAVGFDAYSNTSEDNGSELGSEAVSTETGAEESGQTEVQGTPETKVFDPTEYRDHMVTVKVDGEDVTVPLDEALNGYQRTADYTRKTQELSAMRQQAEAFNELRNQLSTNPQQVIAALESQYGKAAAQQIVDDATASDDDGYADPKLSELEQRLQRFEQAEEDRQLDQTLTGLKDRYGDDFDGQAVINRAVQLGVTEISRLDDVYKAMAFDKIWATQLATKDAASASAADDAARQASAAAASGAVSGESGAVGGASTPDDFHSFEESFNAAVKEHGGWD